MAEEGDDGGRMTLIEHLTELRRRLIICAISVVVCAVVMFLLYNRVLHFLAGPYEKVTRGQPQCGPNPHKGCDLVVTDPLGPFLVRLKIAGYGGIALSIPIIFWQIWRFVTPALHKNERRYALAFLVSSFGLSGAGGVGRGSGALECPLPLLGVLLVRGVSTRQLRQARRWVIVGITIFAAVITPSQDPFSL